MLAEGGSRSPRTRFGPFEFDPATGELRREGAPVHLQQQPAKVLALLVSHPGELVTREQVRQHVWGEGTFVDFQRGLNFAVMQIRTALGDDAGSPRYVETLARRGYRFVAPVEGDAPDTGAAIPVPPALTAAAAPERTAAEPTGPVPAPRPRPGSRPRVLVTGAALLALAAVAIAVWGPVRPAPASGRTMLVVVPFRNLGPADEQFFADGMTDEVASRLASIRGLGVISPTSARQYAGTAKSIRQIGSELGVEYVLEGSVRWERPPSGPARVRVTPKLVRVADEVQVWARIWERELGDVFRLQSELAHEVAGELDVRLGASEPRQVEQAASPEAYEAYARALSARGRNTIPDIRLAIGLLRRAVELDPGFALAWAELSYSHSLLYRHDPPDAPDLVEQAWSTANKALALRPGLPRGHLALGYYHYWCRRDYARAVEEASAAQRGLPGDGTVQVLLGAIRRRQGRMDEALVHQLEVLALSPRDADAALELGGTYVMLGRNEEAVRMWERAIALAPDHRSPYRAWAGLLLAGGDPAGALRTLHRAPGSPAPSWSAHYEYYAGRYEEALRWLSLVPGERAETGGRPPELLRGLVLDAMGRRKEARDAYREARLALERARDRRPGDPWAHSELGLALAGLGMKEAALEAGRKAVAVMPVSLDAIIGPEVVTDLARIQSLVGEHEAAIDSIEQVLALPHARYLLPAPFLRIEPAFRPLHDHPRFRRLAEGARDALGPLRTVPRQEAKR